MSQLVVVSIEDLKPGMYVEAVQKQSGNLKIKTQGRVNSQTTINSLKSKGLLSFFIDPAKSDIPVVDKAAESPQEQIQPEAPEEPVTAASFENEINKAATLYQEAKVIQEKLLDAIQEGLPTDFTPVKECSDAFVESLQRNSNALLCMSHIKEKDDYLLEHSLNVAILMATFAEFLGLEQDLVNELAFAGMLHDVGKIEIPDRILNKPGKHTPEEAEIMRCHVLRGVDIIKNMPEASKVLLEVVAQHHEKLDGKGYPNNLKGSEISEFGRMIAIIDAYDAMTADRCYKKGVPANFALKMLLKYSGSHFDDFLVKQFVKCIGVHPVGSLVRTKSDKAAMVVSLNEEHPLQPVIKVFYSLRSNHFLQPKDVDLSGNFVDEEIAAAIRPEDFNINYKKFFYQFVCPQQ